ncbi:MAG: metallophosphoesterase [Dehalococcoidia bacterium]|nr:metallophosphoesterase [Dehalococcoidia bacterium]
MKIGIISDIHGDVRALRRALDEMQPVDRVLCAGDLVLQYRFSNEVFDIIRERGILTVRGNHEEAILASGGEPLRNSGTISPANLGMLQTLPQFLEMQLDGKRLVMVHTSPLDPANDIRLRQALNGTHLPEMDADILVVGNTHRTMIGQVGNALLINPGSLGEPRDPANPYKRTYAVLDTATWEAVIQGFTQPF